MSRAPAWTPSVWPSSRRPASWPGAPVTWPWACSLRATSLAFISPTGPSWAASLAGSVTFRSTRLSSGRWPTSSWSAACRSSCAGLTWRPLARFALITGRWSCLYSPLVRGFGSIDVALATLFARWLLMSRCWTSFSTLATQAAIVSLSAFSFMILFDPLILLLRTTVLGFLHGFSFSIILKMNL